MIHFRYNSHYRYISALIFTYLQISAHTWQERLPNKNMFNPGFAKGEYRVIDSMIKPGSVVFDVGANCGKWSYYVLTQIPNVRIYAFEPTPDTFKDLTDNLTKIGEKPAQLFQLALSNECGKKNLACYGNTQFLPTPLHTTTSGLNSLFHSHETPNAHMARIKDATWVTVTTSTLDVFCKNQKINYIDFLKIDVEGADFHVIKGATNLIREGKIGVIQFEYNEMSAWAKPHISFKDIFTFCSSCGFDFYEVTELNLKPIPSYKKEFEYQWNKQKRNVWRQLQLTMNILAIQRPSNQ